MRVKKLSLNSKKIGAALAILFIAGLAIATVYSRSYAQRQLPLVHLTLPQTATLAWTFETRSTIRYATDEERTRGFEWAVEIIVPYEAFKDYMSQLMAVNISLVVDAVGFAQSGTHLYSRILDNNDVLVQIGYNHHTNVRDGSGVTVNLELAHGAPVFDNLLPLPSIRECIFTGQPYVYIVHRRDGAWGREFHIERQDVQWGMPAVMGNLANVIRIGGGHIGNNPVVVSEDAPISDGARVRIFD